ncbi:hypothetical protein SPRG_00790 [Saprolegnia parasitica CBS 223.65]|uniref:DPH-type MB domain-containing protein n=1 Tax=Saprolegnia parasitica (strain CBS 223.65) TaxID=695850 RepID=A0A067CW74_SAPPC|nr:hypothetical protein SPRG_00790 [Saprolegnia parasitica CBS 223.65]KDO34728.1 hypothetical protein SPRG_00790 [Saprolegnia parasitica CBS 223.65]|eukprot:XP_012194397.1 hypothetical protein SPRG_00790 [Saprolegnia parasitica CBS 223.65]
MSVYDEIEIEDMEFNEDEQFFIGLDELHDGEDIASCPSCSLTIRIIFDADALPELREDDEHDEEA